MLELIDQLVSHDFAFGSKEEAREHFTRLTNLFKNLNYAREDSAEFADYLKQLHALDAGASRAA